MTNLQKNIIDAIEDAEFNVGNKYTIENLKEEGKRYYIVVEDKYIVLYHGSSEVARVVLSTRIRIVMGMFEAYLK